MGKVYLADVGDDAGNGGDALISNLRREQAKHGDGNRERFLAGYNHNGLALRLPALRHSHKPAGEPVPRLVNEWIH